MSANAAAERTGLAIYLDPPSHHYLGDRIFKADGFNGDHANLPYTYLREFFQSKGIPVRTADLMPDHDDGVRKVYVSTGLRKNYRRLAERNDVVLSAFFALECPIVEPELYRGLNDAQRFFKRIYSWSDSAALERFTGTRLNLHPSRYPQAFDRVHEGVWDRGDRKFLVMINANKLPRMRWQELYTERLRAVEFFSRTEEIDLYGVGWDVPTYILGKTWKPGTLQRAERWLLHNWHRVKPDPLLQAARTVYRGLAFSKSDVLGGYTFSICFENMVLKGWVTEKLFDCFCAGTVPIYWGAPDIEDYVPSECFIDMRQFRDYGELRSFLKSLGESQVRRYRENARDYMGSALHRPFTKEAFADLFCGFIEDDLGLPVERFQVQRAGNV
jgi:hypothetical protein